MDGHDRAPTPESDAHWLRLLLDSTNEGFYTVNRSGETTLCNASFLTLLGFAKESDALGRKLHDVIHHSHPDGGVYAKEDCPIYQCAQYGTPAHINGESFYRLDGVPVPVEYWVRPIMIDGELAGAICTFIDVTQRREAEAVLANALEAKDALLQEVNHRVKNSLQLVVSLLSLQGRQLADGPAKASISEALSRISVVAAVHQELYKQDQHGSVELGPYLANIVDGSLRALSDRNRIDLRIDTGMPVTLGIDHAVPLALIVSELVTNSMKYAFPGEKQGIVEIKISGTADKAVAIEVSDNGIGLPVGFNASSSEGLGMRIIKALTRQIRAEFRYVHQDVGTAFKLTLPSSIPPRA